jgi:hypothetical protein
LQNDQDKITALYSLEFVFYYKKRVDSCWYGKRKN